MGGAVTPYYSDDAVTIYHGDCREILPSLLDGSVDLILTDPPYNVSSRNSRKNTTIGRVPRNRRAIGAMSYGVDGAYREIRRDFGEWDHGWDSAPFLGHVPRLLRKGGSLVAFVTEWTEPAFLASGLDHRCEVYWHKANPAPNFRAACTNAP